MSCGDRKLKHCGKQRRSRAAGQGRSQNKQRELFDTSLAAGFASHAILRGFTDTHYFTCPVVTRTQTNTVELSHTATIC